MSKKSSVIGETFNGIVILEKLESGIKPSGQKFSKYLCKCKCGKLFESRLYPITSGKKTHCGCESFTSYIGEQGKKYNRLTIISLDKERSQLEKSAYVAVLCECGTIKTVSLDSLKRELTKSCGCYSKEVSSLQGKSKKTHGKSKTVEYQTWIRMKGRCNNPNNPDYHLYGGRGIKVCDRWEDNFENFLTDMGNRPEGLELDRIDHNKDYSPENCRWATEQTQAWNRGRMKTNKSGKDGVTFNKACNKWEARISKNGVEISLGLFENMLDAVDKREAAEVELYGAIKNPFLGIRDKDDL